MPTTTTTVVITVAASGWEPSDVIALGALLVAIVVPSVTSWLTLRYQERVLVVGQVPP